LITRLLDKLKIYIKIVLFGMFGEYQRLAWQDVIRENLGLFKVKTNYKLNVYEKNIKKML